VHKRFLIAAILCRDGKKDTQRFSVTLEDLIKFRDWVIEHGCEPVAIESTGIYWHLIHSPQALGIRRRTLRQHAPAMGARPRVHSARPNDSAANPDGTGPQAAATSAAENQTADGLPGAAACSLQESPSRKIATNRFVRPFLSKHLTWQI
jgi:hypothetical protein